jgi:acyl-CoA synthetase (AMP-forming)/AMP-acid ligase II
VTGTLIERMTAGGESEAIVRFPARADYRAVVARIAAWRRTFDAADIPPGAVVAIDGDYSIDACALFLALCTSGRIAAPLPGGADHGTCLRVAAADATVAFTAAGTWSCARLTPPAPAALLQTLRARGAGGVIVFSSGTTGESKAGLFDFEILMRRYHERRRGYRTLAFLLPDHLGGIHTMLHTLSHGGTLIVAEERTPEAICRAIERDRVELLPTTPTFLRMLAISGLHRRHDLSSLRLITYGTEPMPPATLRGLKDIFPNARFKQTYGLSELGVLPTRSRAPDSLWLEIGCDTRVVDGRLWIRSDTAMLGYLDRPSPFDAEGWYDTGDAVEVDGAFLRILGRDSDLINVGGQKVYPAEVEDTLLALDNVRDATAWGQANPVTGQAVAAWVSLAAPEDEAAFERRLYEFCRGRLAPYKIPAVVEIVADTQHGERFKKVRPR